MISSALKMNTTKPFIWFLTIFYCSKSSTQLEAKAFSFYPFSKINFFKAVFITEFVLAFVKDLKYIPTPKTLSGFFVQDKH